MSISVSCYALAISLLFAACTKEGSVGPRGPQGPQGNEGPGGARGPAGPKGDTGTANVVYSAWLDVVFSPSGETWTALIPAPKLDIKNLSTGEYKVYVNFSALSTPSIVPLPYHENPLQIDPIFFTGNIRLNANFDASTQSKLRKSITAIQVYHNPGKRKRTYRY